MRAQVWFCIILTLPCLLRAEDSVALNDGAGKSEAATTEKSEPRPTSPNYATRNEVFRLIRQFSAELWQERENALEKATELDDSAVTPLKEAFEKSSDPEVRSRAVRAIIGIREAPVRGTYAQTSMETADGNGNLRPGDSRDGALIIGGGTVTWEQHFQSTVTSQVYHFDISKKIEVKDKLEIPLTFDYMETVIGYSPESNNPKLEFTRLGDGRLKVVFTGTDGMNQTSKVVFSQGMKKNFLENPAKPKSAPVEKE